ncbi:Nitrate/nitrite response regulator protein narL [Serratia fonticola]|uniref:Nitrate/nitrite response regulator protein narL n=1 Tax=Serratia fonticola TaxID=47917 RepID=A0A4U9V4Z4_SERFO|nr:Nitrate/nitrite response regulator protein narL [Serratia fonticola]
MKNYRVMIVDDHPLMRRGIKQLLGLDPTFTVVAEASGGAEAIALAAQFTPDVILLDLNMKGLSGLDTLKALRDEGVDARIIVLTVSDSRKRRLCADRCWCRWLPAERQRARTVAGAYSPGRRGPRT